MARITWKGDRLAVVGPILERNDVYVWLAGDVDSRRAALSEIRLHWLFGTQRARRLVFTRVQEHLERHPRFRLDLERSLCTLPTCALEVARRIGSGNVFALVREDPIRRLVAVPRFLVIEALSRRLARDLGPVHRIHGHPGLLEVVLRRCASRAERSWFHRRRGRTMQIPGEPRASLLGGDRRPSFDAGDSGVWWVLESRMSEISSRRDGSRDSIARGARATVRGLRRELSALDAPARRSLAERTWHLVLETRTPSSGASAAATPSTRSRGGVVIASSADFDD